MTREYVTITPPPTSEACVDSSNKCTYIKKDGNRCKAYAVNNASLCFSHEPSLSAEKMQAVRLGGSQIKKARVEQEAISINSATDVTVLLNKCVNEIRQGKLSPKEANTIGYLANIILASIKLTEPVSENNGVGAGYMEGSDLGSTLKEYLIVIAGLIDSGTIRSSKDFLDVVGVNRDKSV